MVENVENLPEKGQDTSQTALSARDIDSTDIENFSNINTSMSPDADQTLLAFDGANDGLQLTGTEDFNVTLANTTETESKPDNTESEGSQDINEANNSPVEFGNFGLLGFHPFSQRGAETTKNQDGLIESLEITDSNSKTSIEFSDQGPTITRTTNDDREVTKFNSDGIPESTTIFNSANPDGKEIPVDDMESFSIESIDRNLSLTLMDSDSRSEIIIGPDGKIKSKNEFSDVHKETHYNEDGSASFDAVTTFSENGYKESRRIENEAGITNETFDDYGNWEKSVTNGNDFSQTKTREDDGSIKTLGSRTDGTRYMSLEQQDGTQYHAEALDDTNILTTVSPDGSRTVSSATEDTSSFVRADKDGNWMMYHRNNVSGIINMSHGDNAGPYKKSEEIFDT